MNLDNQDLEIIKNEEELLSNILLSLEEQKYKYFERQTQQSQLAKELNAEIVNTLKAEEKVQIYSSEAVAYGLAQMSKDSIEIINQQLDSPYFARLELEEELPNGNTKKIEYKIGKNANPDCRVIDWRKAPIAKLYYDYNEGDSYFEVIQGQERQGEIKLKNSFEISDGELNKINTSSGKFHKKNNTWFKTVKNSTTPRNSYQQLPDILAFITSEQFSSITADADLPVIIQGVAGSGKTIVAIHRLSWLLHENNSELEANEVVFTVKSTTLLQYIKNSLLEAKIESITLASFNDLLIKILKKLNSQKIAFRKDSIPISCKRLLYSNALAKVCGNYSANIADLKDALKVLKDLLIPDLVQFDTSKLISKELILSAKKRLEESLEDDSYDPDFILLALNLWQKNNPRIFKGLFKHLIIDEIQDFSRIELDLLLGCLENKNQVTLLGDMNQDLNSEMGFPGWDYLKSNIGTSELIQLKISHRSTLPIIKLAHSITKQEFTAEGRSGNSPIWFGCINETSALKACIKWLKTAQDKFPTSLTAVICANKSEAKNLFTMLKPNFESSVRLLDKDLNLSSGIIIAEVAETKGLEFFNVLVWNPSSVNYPYEDQYKRMLYVAATRAEENLSFISWGKASEILKNIPENLMRRFKVT